MNLYALYDTYETETEPGELLCTSDDYAEIVKAAKLRSAETDGDRVERKRKRQIRPIYLPGMQEQK